MASTNTASTDKLIIDLDRLDASNILGDEEYIRKDVIDNMEKNIRRVVVKNRQAIEYYNINDRYDIDDSNSNIPLALHPCFFIHGERGSGKSTLLRGLSYRLTRDQRKAISDKSEESASVIKLLAQVDPTEFAEKESFFIYILSRVAEKIKKAVSQSRTAYNDPHKENYKAALKIIRDMSHGLKMLYDTEDSLRQSEDPSFFIENSISRCASSTDLKKKFYELLEKLCNIYFCDAFLITIDDADLNFSKCYEIMETVRKYMITPRVVFIFAGDMKLYSLVCRDSHLANFHARSLQYDNSRLDLRQELMNVLEDQYMMKIFPAHNRVYLSQFGELLKKDIKQTVILKQNGKTEALSEYLNRCLKLIYPADIHRIIRNTLSNQPMRKMLQMFRSWGETLKLSDQSLTENPTYETLEVMSRGFRNAFSNTLIERQIDFTSIHQLNFNELLKSILIHIAELGGNDDCTKLAASVGTASDRAVSMYLNSETIRNLTSCAQLIRYLLFVFPHTQIAIEQVLYRSSQLSGSQKTNGASSKNDNGILPDTSHFQEELKYQLLQQYYTTVDQDNKKFGAWLTAYLDPNFRAISNTAKRYGYGVVRLMQKSRSQKKEQLQKFIVARQSIYKVVTNICDITKNLKTRKHALFILMLYNSLCIVERDRKKRLFLSIYCLIETITSVLESYVPGKKTDSIESFKKVIDIKDEINTIRAYNIIQETANDLDASDDSDESDEARSRNDVRQEALCSDLSEAYKECSVYYQDIYNAVYEWAKKYTKVTFAGTPINLDCAWKNFRAKHMRITENARIHSNDTNCLAKGGYLFVEYMKSFVDALKSATNEHNMLISCITEFPLCEPIFTQQMEVYNDLWEKINDLNIGLITTTKEPAQEISTSNDTKENPDSHSTNTNKNKIRRIEDNSHKQVIQEKSPKRTRNSLKKNDSTQEL